MAIFKNLFSKKPQAGVDDPILGNTDLNGHYPNLHDHDVPYASVDPEVAKAHVNDAYHNSDFAPPTYSDSQNGGVSYEYVDPEVAKAHVNDAYHNSDFAPPTYSDAEQDRIDFCGSPDEQIYNAVKNLSTYNYSNLDSIKDLLEVVKQDPESVKRLLDHRVSDAMEMLDKQDIDPSKLGMTFAIITELQNEGFSLDNFVDTNYLAGVDPSYAPLIETINKFKEAEGVYITIPGENGSNNVPITEAVDSIQALYDQTKELAELESSEHEPN